jgi:PAS domain S-box-containing protein
MDYRLLLVSSNEETKASVNELLIQAGYDFLVEPAPAEWDKIRFESFDLIILDIHAEDADSFSFIRFFNEKNLAVRIPLIAITSFQNHGFIDNLCNSGIFDFMLKPVGLPEFKSRIAKAIGVVNSYRRIDQKMQDVQANIDNLEDVMTSSANTSFAYIVMTPSGEIEWVNEGFEKLHGYNLNEYRAAHGKTIFGLAPGTEITNLFYNCLNGKKTVECTCKLRLRSDHSRWLMIFMMPRINAEGSIEKVVAIEVDISSFKTKEEELNAQYKRTKEIMRTLEKANAQLEVQKGEINQQKMIIEEEQEKSEKLLLNILPFEVAKQLKSKGRAGTRQYKLVSVLFTDFKGFSNISKTLDPKDLVSILDSYFAKFDEITGAHYIEKIKTIGDAYMCAGGLPLSNKSNPIDAVLAGLEIQYYMNTLNDSKVLNNLPVWELRLGIHTGPVVAGVVGKKRFAYDIWGDTVNIASRMEQSGHVGWVNVSGTTYEYIKDFFNCDYRGKIETKNLGKIDMYFVNRIKPEYSRDKLGILPNDQLINVVNKL